MHPQRPGIKGATVCYMNGVVGALQFVAGRSARPTAGMPQVREAARLRMALAVTPALQRLVAIITHGEDGHALGAIKEVLSRNQLYGLGVEPKGPLLYAQAITVQTQVNLPEMPLASMTDDELARYKALPLELRALVPKGDKPGRS